MSSYKLHQAELYSKMLKDGYHTEFIAEYFGVSPSTVRQTIHTETHKLECGCYDYIKSDIYRSIYHFVPEESQALRIYNALRRNKLNSIDALKEVDDDDLIKMRGIGWKTISIIHNVKHEILSKTKFNT